MVRNITSIKVNNLFTKNTKGMVFTIPKDVAIVVGQSLFGTYEVPNTIDTIDLQRKLDHAYDTRIFAWRIRVK